MGQSLRDVHIPRRSDSIAEHRRHPIDEQLVRLLQIDDNSQLRLNDMLETGVERCGGSAALYLRVDPSCPIYWARRWDKLKTNVDLDVVVCGIPYRGSRDSILNNLVACTLDCTGGMRLRHDRNKPGFRNLRQRRPTTCPAIIVNTIGCDRIVGTEAFATHSSTRGGNDTGEENREGEGEEEEEE